MEKKSIAVRVLGVLLLLLGFFTFIILTLPLITSTITHTSFSTFLAKTQMGDKDVLGLFLSPMALYLVNVAYSLGTMAFSVGVLFFKNWGRIGLVGLILFEFLWLLGDLFIAGKSFETHHAVEMVILTGLLVYLNLPKLRAQFT